MRKKKRKRLARAEPPRLPVISMPNDRSEYTSVALGEWAHEHGVQLHFNRPGKPTDNPFIESLKGKFRDECLNENWFLGVEDARRTIAAWRKEYNEERPHMSLGMRPAAEFAALWSPPALGTPQTPGQTTNRPGLS